MSSKDTEHNTKWLYRYVFIWKKQKKDQRGVSTWAHEELGLQQIFVSKIGVIKTTVGMDKESNVGTI